MNLIFLKIILFIMENFKHTRIDRRVWGSPRACTPSPAVLSSGPRVLSPLSSTPSSAWIILEQILDIILTQPKYSRLSLRKMQRFTHGRRITLVPWDCSKEINNHFPAPWDIWPAAKISHLWTLEAPPPTPNVPPTPTPGSTVCWLKMGILKEFLGCNWLILLLASLGACLHSCCILF